MSELGIVRETLLVFGGPYGNLAATQAMQRESRRLGITPQRVICSGDLVAYCAEPVETVDLIRDWGIHVVMGNCEESLAFAEPDCGCGFEPGSSCSTLAQTWYEYAAARIRADQRRWMKSLARYLDWQMGGSRFRLVHGSVSSINEFVFPSTDPGLKSRQLEQSGADVIIGGHSGIPFGQQIGARYWLNAGVIGMPANDGSSAGWYLLIEPGQDKLKISWHRLTYDHQASHVSTRAAGMTEYAQALLDGLWPSMDNLPESERRQRGQALNLPVMYL